MLEDRSIAVFLAMVLFSARAGAQAPATISPLGGSPSGLSLRAPESSSSPAAAVRFREIAYELAHSKDLTADQADQAIILLLAARSLDHSATDIEPLLLQLATRHTRKDYSDQVLLWLGSYVSESADRTIVMDAIRYLLDRLNSREQRQEMLETLVKRIGNRNAAIDSELATLLGLLMVEKADTEAAKFYMLQGYTNNKHNQVAFAKLAELVPNEIGPAVYLEHLRLMLRENPLDINAAMRFAQQAERLQLYDLSALSYQYCADLFRYLYPTEPLPPHVYLPWAISCYNSRQGQQMCLLIAESIRNRGQFDILLESIAGKAAAKAGNATLSQQIFLQAEQRAQQILLTGSTPRAAPPGTASQAVQLNTKQLAWFYCFANLNPAKAASWANQAYRAEPNSPSAGALVAYALSMNNQLELAKPYLAAFEHTQIADLVQAKVQLAEGNKTGTLQTLRMAIARDAGSLAAETARQMLKDLGSEYVPPVDAGVLTTYLTQSLGKSIAPQFLAPDKMIEVQFSVRGNNYSYGNDLVGVIGIVNRGVEPLVITESSLFQGGIRIDARVAGGVKKTIADLLSETVRKDLVVEPGKSFLHEVKLSTGELGDLLATYPQASLDIQFTLYLDPVVGAAGVVTNRLIDLKPVTISINRPAVDITASYVRNRYQAIASGQEGQKIQTARLFTGLLREQRAMAEHGTLYPYQYADWLPELLRSSLVNASGLLLSQGRDDWAVMVNTMADMLPMEIDQDLATAVAKNLNHPRWPVRLMATYLLARRSTGNFNAVLDWVAKQDDHELVRSIAMSLQSGSGPASVLSIPSELTTREPLALRQ